MNPLPYQLGCSTYTQRQFAARGELRVQVGDRVEPDTVLGTEPARSEPIIVNVAAILRRPPPEVRELLLVEIGEKAPPGAVLARSGSRECRTPEGGMMASYDPVSGLATVLRSKERVELRANVAGVIADLVPGRRVVIETRGAFVEGEWGAGGHAHGVLRVAVQSPLESVPPDELDHRYTYSILVAGRLLTAEVLRRCAELEVRAVLAGGMLPSEFFRFAGASAALPAALRTLPPPERGRPATPAIVLLSGFGDQPLPDGAWRVLRACDGREGSLLAPGWPAKPRLLVALPRQEAPDPRPLVEARLEPGATVRITGRAAGSAIATVLQHPAPRMVLASGAPVEAVSVRTRDGEEARVPLYNVSVIENV